MHRVIRILFVVVFSMASLTAVIAAQEASPPAAPTGMPTSFEIAPGVVADNMVFAAGVESPVSYRLTFEAGVVYEVMPSSNLEVAHLEFGSLVLTLDTGVTVFQLGEVEGTGEHFAAGTEITLDVGNYFVLQPGVGGVIRNDSSEPAVVSVAGLIPALQEESQDATPEG